MNKKRQAVALFFILTINLSCVEKKASKNDEKKQEWPSTSTTDTLTFTSGIRAIFQDRKGNYWLGSQNEGLSRYDGKSFTYFTTNEGLAANQIRSIKEDSSGNIWVETGHGVSSYDGTTFTHHTPIVDAASHNEWMKTEQDLWFGAGNSEGVYRYDGHELHYLAFPKHKVLNPYDNLSAVTGMSTGQDNRIWIGTYAGIWGYRGGDFTVINDETLGFDRKTNRLHIRSILEDSKGRLWIGNNGIGVLLKEGDTVINFSEKHHLIHPTSTRKGDKSLPGTLEHVFTIEEDSEGNIWFGDRDTGAWKFDGKTVKNFPIGSKLSSLMIRIIYSDNNNNLLFGRDDGVYAFNGTSFDKMF